MKRWARVDGVILETFLEHVYGVGDGQNQCCWKQNYGPNKRKTSLVLSKKNICWWAWVFCKENRKPTHTNRYLPTRHITPNIRRSLLPKLYSVELILTSRITHRSTGTTKHTQYLATTWISYQNHFFNFKTFTLPECTIQSFHFFTYKEHRKVKRILNKAGVKVAVKSVHTIGRIQPSPKDPLTLEKKKLLSV